MIVGNPKLAIPIAQCWADKDGKKTVFFNVAVGASDLVVAESLYFNGATNVSGTAQFGAKGNHSLAGWFPLVSGNIGTWYLNGSSATVDVTVQPSCVSAPVTIAIRYNGPPPSATVAPTVIANFRRVIATTTGLPESAITVVIVTSTKRDGFVVQVTFEANSTVSPALAGSLVLEQIEDDPTEFEVAALGATIQSAQFAEADEVVPEPAPSPTPSPPSPSTPSDNSSAVMATSLLAFFAVLLVL